MVNATFNNVSVISRQSVLLVEETGVPGEKHRSAANRLQTLLHNVESNTHTIFFVRNEYNNNNDIIMYEREF